MARDGPSLAWLLAGLLLLASLPLLFLDALAAQTGGRNEEAGALLALAAALLFAWGAWGRHRAGRPARAAVVVAVAIPALFVAWFVFVMASAPDFDAVRSVEFTPLAQAPEGAPTLPPEALPADARATLRAAVEGERGSFLLGEEEHGRFWAALEEVGATHDGEGWSAWVEGRAYRFAYGPAP